MTAVVEPASVERPRPRPRPRRHWRIAVPRRWRSWWVEGLLAVAGYELYSAVQAATDTERAEAVRHGRAIIHLEQHLHMWVEPTVNRWLNGHSLLSLVADGYYELSHPLVTAVALVWLWRRHRTSYLRWRNTLLGLSVAALAVFWTYAVAPPRMAAPGLTDVLVKSDPFHVTPAASMFVDLYAAMPSLHVAWAVWVAAAVIGTSSHRLRWLAAAYPVTTTVVVVMTANHYLLDAVAGAGLTAAAVVLARQFRRSPRRS